MTRECSVGYTLFCMTQYIVGLGNPGEKYRETRHNVGRIILEHIRRAEKFTEWEASKKYNALVSSGKLQGKSVEFFLPETFMNNSGKALAHLKAVSVKQKASVVVLHDELDIPIGSFKISFKRGSGGHRGVESIIRALKTEAFIRIRVGISPATPGGKLKKPKGSEEVEKFILGTFKPKELEVLKRVSKRINEALVVIISEGKDRAMNEFN